LKSDSTFPSHLIEAGLYEGELHAEIGRFGEPDWMDPSWFICGEHVSDFALRSPLSDRS
jgi:hypothetical protein